MLHALLLWPFFFFFPFWGFHGLGSLILVIVILALIFGRRRYYYYDHPWGWHGGGSRQADALAILEARYARGEIQREEYLQKKHDLGG